MVEIAMGSLEGPSKRSRRRLVVALHTEPALRPTAVSESVQWNLRRRSGHTATPEVHTRIRGTHTTTTGDTTNYTKRPQLVSKKEPLAHR